jgi:hypothetical protein
MTRWGELQASSLQWRLEELGVRDRSRMADDQPRGLQAEHCPEILLPQADEQIDKV